MTALGDLVAYGRFAAGLGPFLRRPLTLEQARAVVRERLADRGGMLLRVVEKGVYGNPASPYRALLRSAGCELGDFRRLVAECGVEGTLRQLRGAGVWVSFEEFKGRRSLVRDGRELTTGPRAFDNPLGSRYYHGTTGGSTGPGTRVAFDLDHLYASTPCTMLALEANGVLGSPIGVWRTILPGLAGVSTVLRSVLRGRVAERWFSPLEAGELRASVKDRLATELILLVGRAAGVRLPRPEPVALGDAKVIATWVRRTLDREGACVLHAPVSCLLRAALAAHELGLDLGGAVFFGGGEPPTPAKLAPIAAVGARYVPTYVLSDAGAIGHACAQGADATDMHLMADSIAVIQHPTPVPGTGVTVDAFHVTTLLPTAPKLLLNVEIDDFGVLEERRCGCPLDGEGLRTHVRQVRSSRKLTGEGMTLLGSDVVRVLEEELPGRFGGSPLDYQLVQEEDASGFTRLVLMVHPRLEIADEEAVARAMLAALGGGDDASELARAVWTQAGTLSVRRAVPTVTAAGKFLPLRVLSARSGTADGGYRPGRVVP